MTKIRKAIIPVAGMGTRFLPATKATPKEMLPIVDKPTIQYIVEEAVNSGIEEIIFVTSPYKNSVQDHFDRSFELETRLERNGKLEVVEQLKSISKLAKFYYIRQGEPLGTGHAIGLCADIIGNEPFAVLYGDDVTKSNDVPTLKKMIDIHDKYDCNVMCSINLSDTDIPTKGILAFEDIKAGKINGLVEKPKLSDAPSREGTIGRYILNPEVFEILKHIKPIKGEYLLTDAMSELMRVQPFYAYRLEEEYHDVGNKFGYIKANMAFGLEKKELREELLSYIKSII